jgi:hypothetical protein
MMSHASQARLRVPVFAVALCLIPVLAAPQSLGEAARRQAGQRTRRTRATSVFTDEDLKPNGAAPHPDALDSPAAAGTVDEVAPSDPAGAANRAPAGEDATRAQLDREAELRRQRELAWRGEAAHARSWLAAAQREHDIACGPGVLVLTGG